MRGANLAGWGPLAPGEAWAGAGTPALYLKANSTFASYTASAREIDPAGFGEPPKDPLAAAKFLDALPSPPISSDRLEYVRSLDRPGLIRLSPSLPPMEHPRMSAPERSQPVTRQAPPPAPARPPVPQPVIVMGPAPEPIVETYYLAPIYTGIIIMNPPEKKPPKKKKPDMPAERGHRDSDDDPPLRSDENTKPAP
jgi:hypothetical protein